MEKTPKQKYDEIMKGVEEQKLRKQGKDPEEERQLNEAVEELDKQLEGSEQMEEKELDKNMGEIKEPNQVSMTKEQYDSEQATRQARESISQLYQQQKDKLSPKQEAVIKGAVESFQKGEIKDPVLMHMIEKRMKLMERHDHLSEECRQIQQQMLNEITKLTNQVTETKGAIKEVEKDLLEKLANKGYDEGSTA